MFIRYFDKASYGQPLYSYLNKERLLSIDQLKF